ncbi:hypothetical protein H696_01326 [Fonticula alba]|uniref:Uncharacterized protein n=1 Tax=Fonticula alba TaxID=691883 RepID=A0A058ZDA4_FONAL|nr:hypothetical protein H696_01326 [Fonticula alba]KCV71916.1 hypothetical protein H696_01326 [Fonticula alba]|eukprot:XP_009493494.1 hypothetical protein H696_01326 [Fonticula alba]
MASPAVICTLRPRAAGPPVDPETTYRDSLPVAKFLLNYPQGAYTTARTVAFGERIVEFESHMFRLAESLRMIHFGPPDAEPAHIAAAFAPLRSTPSMDGVDAATNGLHTGVVALDEASLLRQGLSLEELSSMSLAVSPRAGGAGTTTDGPTLEERMARWPAPPAAIARIFWPLLGACRREFFARLSPADSLPDLRLTLVISWDKAADTPVYAVHCGLLPPAPIAYSAVQSSRFLSPPTPAAAGGPVSVGVTVEIRGNPRLSAAAKDCKWIHNAFFLRVTQLPEPGQEPSFAVDLLTAPVGAVLAGTIRSLVVDLAPKIRSVAISRTAGIPVAIRVVEDFPSTGDLSAGTLHAGFITSTSRAVCPIARAKIFHGENTEPEIVDLIQPSDTVAQDDPCVLARATVAAISRLVSRQMYRAATPLTD